MEAMGITVGEIENSLCLFDQPTIQQLPAFNALCFDGSWPLLYFQDG